MSALKEILAPYRTSGSVLTYHLPTIAIRRSEDELTAPLLAEIAALRAKVAKADVLWDRVAYAGSIASGDTFKLLRAAIRDYDAAPVAASTDAPVEDEPINEFAVLKRLDDLDRRVTKIATDDVAWLRGNLEAVFAEIRDIKERQESHDQLGAELTQRLDTFREILECTDDPEYDTDDMPAVSKRMAAAANRAYKASYGQTHERGRWKLAIQAALVQQGRREE